MRYTFKYKVITPGYRSKLMIILLPHSLNAAELNFHSCLEWLLFHSKKFHSEIIKFHSFSSGFWLSFCWGGVTQSTHLGVSFLKAYSCCFNLRNSKHRVKLPHQVNFTLSKWIFTLRAKQHSLYAFSKFSLHWLHFESRHVGFFLM